MLNPNSFNIGIKFRISITKKNKSKTHSSFNGDKGANFLKVKKPLNILNMIKKCCHLFM